MSKKIYELTSSEKSIIQFLKIIFCIMVIFIHSFRNEIQFNENNTIILDVPTYIFWIKYIISKILCRCAVPGFFLLSGVLLFKKDFKWKDNIKKKLKTLLIPFLLLNTFWICLFFIFQNIPQLNQFFSAGNNIISNWKLFDWINAFTGINGYPLLYPLWFIKDLFILNMLAVLIKKICNKYPKIVLLLIGTLFILNINIPYSILSNDALVFFTLGYYIVHYNLHLSDIKKIKNYIIIPISILAIIIDCLFINTFIAKISMQITIISILIIIIKLALFFKDSNFISSISKIGVYSFSIYLFHEMTLTISIKICTKVLSNNYLIQLLEYFILPFLVFGYCVLISKLLKKFAPKLYTLITGNRVI